MVIVLCLVLGKLVIGIYLVIVIWCLVIVLYTEVEVAPVLTGHS